jgi:plasmid stability protein
MLQMTVTLSIKNVPDDLAQKLKERAARNHRSLQGELMAIIEAAEPPKRSIREIYAMVKASGVKTPSESARMVREDRDDPSR